MKPPGNACVALVAACLLGGCGRHEELPPGEQLIGVWAGTPVLTSVESANTCIARNYARWGHPSNPLFLSVERHVNSPSLSSRYHPDVLHVDVIDFFGQAGLPGTVCPYSGNVTGTSFAFTTENSGTCRGATRIDECGPTGHFQFTRGVIDGSLEGSTIHGKMVETWNTQDAAHTPITVTSTFSFAFIGREPMASAGRPGEQRPR